MTNNVIRIESRENLRVKQGKYRIVPMHRVVYQTLRTIPQKEARVFKDVKGHWVTRLFQCYIVATKINPDLHFHSLRHTFATWLVEEVVQIYEVQKLLGHWDIKVTKNYAHLKVDTLRPSVERI